MTIYAMGKTSSLDRAKIYGFLERIFVSLPDEELVNDLLSGNVDEFLETLDGMGSTDLRRGVAHVKSYLTSVQTSESAKILEEISVDRTRILRTAADKSFKLPYESLFIPARNPAEIIAAVKEFYSKAGIMPEDSICEMPDYFGVEFDFMYQLCLREAQQKESGQDAKPTIRLEKEFLQLHLGRWLGAYCREAEKYCRTDFYRGFLEILAGFIEIEMDYLSGLGV